jgi:ferredoxin
LFSSEWKDNDGQDSNQWQSSSNENNQGGENQPDWQDVMAKKQDGSFWSSFEPSADESNNNNATGSDSSVLLVDPDSEQEDWLDQLAALSAEEVNYNLKEADRADKARQMQEWGFDQKIIQATLGVATDTSLEVAQELEGMQAYREESYLEDSDVDFETVESHTRVETDPTTGEPVRAQMVYVDEHTCIGCTHCAMIAQSTFFMHQEHGRARVFSQWGDDDETIQVAIETCPVDCIHYIPYEELVRLEVDRRGQNINFKARLVSQGESGNSLSHRVGGANAFTAPQVISGNMGTRCSNCPSRGCGDCPMFGVGKNPEFEKKEQSRKELMAKRRLQKEREDKSAEL